MSKMEQDGNKNTQQQVGGSDTKGKGGGKVGVGATPKGPPVRSNEDLPAK